MSRFSLETRIKTLVLMEAIPSEELFGALNPDDRDPKEIEIELKDATVKGDVPTAAVKTMQLLRRGLMTPKDAAVAMTDANHGAQSFYAAALDMQKEGIVIEPIIRFKRTMTKEDMEAARDESVRREIRWSKLAVEACKKEQGI